VAREGWSAEERKVKLGKDGATLTVVLRPDKPVIDEQAGEIYLNRKVFFELDKDDLQVASCKTLDQLVALLLAHPEIELLRIEGHTDAQGSDDYNMKLSQRRAEAVRAYLVKNGVAPDRLVAKGYGETRPLQQGDSEEVYATNRRVEFHVVREAKP